MTDDLMRTLRSIAATVQLGFCACGSSEWNGTGQCLECWTETEQSERPEEAGPEDVYYNICDR